MEDFGDLGNLLRFIKAFFVNADSSGIRYAKLADRKTTLKDLEYGQRYELWKALYPGVFAQRINETLQEMDEIEEQWEKEGGYQYECECEYASDDEEEEECLDEDCECMCHACGDDDEEEMVPDHEEMKEAYKESMRQFTVVDAEQAESSEDREFINDFNGIIDDETWEGFVAELPPIGRFIYDSLKYAKEKCYI